MLVLVATIRTKPEQRAVVEAVLARVAPLVARRDGCIEYALHRGKDCLVVIEKWRDAEALRGWGESPLMRELHHELEPLVEDLDNNFVVVRPVPIEAAQPSGPTHLNLDPLKDDDLV